MKDFDRHFYETYGCLGVPFLTLLKDAATLEAENAPAGDKGGPQGQEALRGFILRRSVARVSVARIRAITRRIVGATVKVSRAIGAQDLHNTVATYAFQQDIARDKKYQSPPITRT